MVNVNSLQGIRALLKCKYNMIFKTRFSGEQKKVTERIHGEKSKLFLWLQNTSSENDTFLKKQTNNNNNNNNTKIDKTF